MSTEPVSWLMLERYALGELSPDERAQVEQRLAMSDADRACLASILADDTVLPPLPTPLPRRKRAWWIGAALAAAAALAFIVPAARVPSHRRSDEGLKGGEVAITLFSERTGNGPEVFRDGDRFKLMVTCPVSLAPRLSVLMFQDGRRYQPLARPEHFACGNQVPWPGAFSLDGEGDVDVCLSWAESTQRARSAGELAPEVTCVRLRHE
ncbi:MAG TPA: hypothetical protein VI299_12885 [Polyangiales bacterium]